MVPFVSSAWSVVYLRTSAPGGYALRFSILNPLIEGQTVPAVDVNLLIEGQTVPAIDANLLIEGHAVPAIDKSDSGACSERCQRG